MTYIEKLKEYGEKYGLNITLDLVNGEKNPSILIINNEFKLRDCPHRYFNIPELEWDCDCECNVCWNSEYKDEPFIGNEILSKYTPVNDPVNHPNHYNAHNIEVIDFIQDWELNFCLGNAIKYICRADFKGNAIEDLKKAIQYLEFEIKRRGGE